MSTQPTDDLKEYSRPDLTETEISKARRMAAQVLQQPFMKKSSFVHILIMENMMLTKEVQLHRQALGYKPLKEYS